MKLDPAFKEQWIAALTSGEYVHATGALYREKLHHWGWADTVSYCCLGVACALKGCTFGDSGRTALYNGCKTDENAPDGLLPINLSSEIGLSPEDQTELAELNDKAYWEREFPATVIDYIRGL